MPNIGALLKSEISRLAREVRAQTEALKKSSSRFRKTVAEMKRQISDLQRKVVSLEKQIRSGATGETALKTSPTKTYRFSPKGIQSRRRRLGLSAAQFGKLVGVTGQTIYKWEKGLSRPRNKHLAALAGVRNMGKKEALARLQELTN